VPIVSARLLEAFLKAFPGRLLADLRHSQCQYLGLGLGLQGACRASTRAISLEESTIWRPSLPNCPPGSCCGNYHVLRTM